MLVSSYQVPDETRVYYCSADEKHEAIPAEAECIGTYTEEELANSWTGDLKIHAAVRKDGIYVRVITIR